MRSPLMQLHHQLDQQSRWIITVSGGISSLTLATIAHRYLQHPPLIIHIDNHHSGHGDMRAHAIQQLAQQEGWDIRIIHSHKPLALALTSLKQDLLLSHSGHTISRTNPHHNGNNPIDNAKLQKHDLWQIAQHNNLSFVEHFEPSPAITVAA